MRRPGRRPWWPALVIFLALIAFRPAPARAQTPADSAAILLQAATHLRDVGQEQGARALLEQILSRYPGTPAAAEAERLLSSLAAAHAPGPTPSTARSEDAGKTELIVFGTLYGLWLGAAIPAAAGADQARIYGAGLLLGGPAGFAAARTYAASVPVSEGQARAITFGGTWGTWQGFGWAQVLDLGSKRHEFCPPTTSPGGPCESFTTGASRKAVLTTMIAAGLVGIGAGAALASGREITPGTATTVSLASLWGSGFGLGLVALTGEDDGDPLLTGALIGGDAALVTTALLAPQWRLSRERARLISIAGLAGLAAGLGADLLLQSDNARVNALIPMLTSAGGLAAGTVWTRDTDAARSGGGGGEGGGNGGAEGGGRSGGGAAAGGGALGGGAAGGDGALLQLRDGALHLGAVQPAPTLLRDAQGRLREPGVYIPLVHARF